MCNEWILPMLVLLPALFAGASLLLPTARAVLRFCAAGTLAVAAVAAVGISAVFRSGPVFAAGNWLMLDALSAYHLAVLAAVFDVDQKANAEVAGQFHAAAAASLEELLARARKEFGDPVDFDAASPAAGKPVRFGRKSAR